MAYINQATFRPQMFSSLKKDVMLLRFFFPTLPVSHLAEMHDIDSKLLVAVHFLSKEEQEVLVKTTQPRMLIEGREEGGKSEEALLPTGLFQGSTFTSVAMKVQLFQFFIFFAISYVMLGEDVGKGWIL